MVLPRFVDSWFVEHGEPAVVLPFDACGLGRKDRMSSDKD